MAADLTGLVLAGGRGERLGGRDKGLVLLDSKPLVAHLAERLRPQVKVLLISANRNQAAYADYGRVVGDLNPNFDGPMAGLQAGLHAAATEWILSVPCDAVGVSTTLAQQLMATAYDTEARAAFVTLGTDALYPCCLLHHSLRTDLDRWLTQPDRALRHWLHAVGAVAVPISGWTTTFWNLNTADELARAEAGMRQQRSPH